MSGKHISIAEGGVGRQFTSDELSTPKVGGGTQLWVPKDEVRLTTKNINKNGTYAAKSDGYYGFEKVTVNVSGGNGSADSHGKPTGTIPPGDIGSAVIGVDEDGNDAVIGVDKDGKLVKTPIPTYIVLVTPPTKTNYNDGETIDLSGAVVTAKMADGTTWTDADHPNGHVSCTPDPAAADASQASGYDEAMSQYVDIPITICPHSGSGYHYPESSFVNGSVIIASDSPKTVYVENDDGYSFYLPISKQITIEGRTAYWGSVSVSSNWLTPPPQKVNASNEKVAWTMVYGTITQSGTQTIALNWARPGDGKVLSTTMEINVGAHTTESSSGTSGSGGGGGF